MYSTRITSARKQGFTAKTLYKKKEHRFQTLRYLQQKSSFFVASLSLLAFVMGNMVGEHGWYAFWKSVMGKYDDSLVTYTGTVPPLAYVPDYSKWSTYGGNAEQHLFRQVPKDLLIPLPPYDPALERQSYGHGIAGDIYSVGDRGSYHSGAEGEGSHPGVDIRVPEGTPVRSIANGIVERVGEDAGGFGKFIVIRHPHAPDPLNTNETTVLHSVYAHLSAQFVTEGDLVQKGQDIALSGQTGFATGPHLHFQLDRDEAPWHPYWPFTSREANEAGLSFTAAINAGLHQERLAEFTAHPMLYVQANYKPVKDGRTTTMAAAQASSSSKARVTATPEQTLRQHAATLRAQRIQRRIAQHSTILQVFNRPAQNTPPAVIPEKTVVVAYEESITTPAPAHVATSVAKDPPVQPKTVVIEHDGVFSGRGWERVRIRLHDEHGAIVTNPLLTRDLYVRTAFGEAEFKPQKLTVADFVKGVATIEVLPRGNRTVVLSVEPYGVMSEPLRYVSE